MGGMPLMVVAKNLGHADTRMVERHYGHLAPSYVAEAVRKHAPKFGKTPFQCEGAVMDWRKIGRELYERERVEAPARTVKATVRPMTQEEALGSALLQSARGNSTRLVAYLRSDMPLTLPADNREFLANSLSRRKRRGPSRDNEVRYVVFTALVFYEQWKRANQRAGISNRGLANAMKDESCEYALKLNGLKVNSGTVREMMERPKHRRVSR